MCRASLHRSKKLKVMGKEVCQTSLETCNTVHIKCYRIEEVCIKDHHERFVSLLTRFNLRFPGDL